MSFHHDTLWSKNNPRIAAKELLKVLEEADPRYLYQDQNESFMDISLTIIFFGKETAAAKPPIRKCFLLQMGLKL